MTKETEIDGKVFAKELFTGAYVLKSKKGPSFLKQLRDDKEFKNQWKILWKGRLLKTEEEYYRFLRIQAFKRNPIVQAKEKEFAEKGRQEFIRFAFSNWFIDPMDIVFFENGISEIFLAKSETKKEPIDIDEEVTVIFKETDYMGNYEEIKDYIQTSMRENKESVFDYSSYGYDLGIVEEDRYQGRPIVYLRVDLNKYNKATKEKINSLLRSKIKELKCRPRRKDDFNQRSLEIAFMIGDLDKYGFTDENIAHFTGRDEGYVKEKLKLYRSLIDNCIKREFPYPSKISPL